MIPNDPIHREWVKAAKWAYLGAFAALGIDPGPAMAQRLAEMTKVPDDLVKAIRAMVDAPRPYPGCVNAALDYLEGRATLVPA